MADDLPPGYTLREPVAAPAADDLPPGYKLREPEPSEGPPAPTRTREQQIRLDALNKLMVKDPDVLDRAVDAYSLHMIRPLQGVKTLVEGKAKEWLGGGEPATAGEYYRGGYGAQEDYIDRAREYTPGPAGTTAEILGSVGSGFTGGGALSRGGQAAVSGLQGFIGGASQNADDVGKAVKGGVAGGTVDAATSFTVGALLDRLKGIKKPEFLSDIFGGGKVGDVAGARKDLGVASRQGSSQSKAADSGVILDKLDSAGIHFSGKETPKLANGVNEATAGPLPASVRSEINEVVQDVNRRAQNGAMTFGDVRAIQSEISKLKANSNPDVRRVAKDMSKAVDDFFDTAKPTMPASSVGAVGPDDLKEARKLYAQSKHMGKIEGLEEAATTAVKDPATKTASTFKSYEDKFTKNPDKFNPNDPAQRRIIADIAEGSPGKEKLAKYADYGATGLTGAGVLSGVGGYVSPYLGGPDATDRTNSLAGSALLAALALKGGSNAFRHSAAQHSAAKVNDLLRNIATGSTKELPGAYAPRDALATIMAAQQWARGAGNYASSLLNKEE